MFSLPAHQHFSNPQRHPFQQVQAAGRVTWMGLGATTWRSWNVGRGDWGKRMYAKGFKYALEGSSLLFLFSPFKQLATSHTKRGEKSRDLEPPLRMCKRLIYWEQRVSDVIPMQLNPLGHSEFSLLQLPDCQFQLSVGSGTRDILWISLFLIWGNSLPLSLISPAKSDKNSNCLRGYGY